MRLADVMVVDSSAVLAVLLGEPVASDVLDVLEQADDRCMAAPTRLELGIVVTARTEAAGLRALDRWMREAQIRVVPFTERHGELAVDAFYRYGKGRHPAGLSFGDCISYALAIDLDAPLLVVGDHFARTDVRLAR